MKRTHEELAPPRIAWARRLILLGVLLLGADYVIDDFGEIYGPWLADRLEVTGDLRVGVLNEDQIEAAFERVRTADPKAVLIFIDADHQGRKYEVHVTAPDRDRAIEQSKALLAAFAAECTAQGGRILWTSANGTPRPQLSPPMGLLLRRIKLGLLLSGLATAAAGGLLYVDPRKLGLRR